MDSKQLREMFPNASEEFIAKNATDAGNTVKVARQHPEADLREFIRGLAKMYGWAFYFTHTSRFSPAGFPDIWLCKPPRLIAVELKSEKGKLTPAQIGWRILLEQCPGLEYHVWRPSDMDIIPGYLE